MMDILYVTSNLPFPSTDGARIRLFSFIKYVSQRHRISILSFLRTTEDEHAVEALRAYCADVQVIRRKPGYSPWKLLRGLIGPTAFGVINYYDPDMASRFKNMVRERNFDIVQVENIHMAQYCLNAGCPTILDLHNVDSMLMRRYAEQERNPLKRGYAEVTWRKLAAYEREVCARFAACLTCSEEDRRLWVEQTGADRVHMIPNGALSEDYLPNNEAELASNWLVFVGRMDYRPNIDAVRWFCQEILPHIYKVRPNVVFQIVGGNPTKEVCRLAAPGRVEVTGFVEDVRPYLRAASVVVVPLRVGGGTRFKILEAMAMGKAVVSTALGAEGIACTPGRDILIATNPQEFASYVLKVLDSLDIRKRLGIAGRELVKRHYDWNVIGQKLEDVYHSCLQAGSQLGTKV
jgi:sugar transferase (PEP-CTERM/EpsH1 system associated)